MRAIQKIIQVMSPTATIDRVPPTASWAAKLSVDGPQVSTAPKVSETRTARPTPVHSTGSRSRRCVRTR